jgi:hypothetical protein
LILEEILKKGTNKTSKTPIRQPARLNITSIISPCLEGISLSWIISRITPYKRIIKNVTEASNQTGLDLLK